MARELYNFDQGLGYGVIALHNLKQKDKSIKIDLEDFIREAQSLQTMYGKEGVIGLAQRYVKQEKNND